jgi:D-sedoheptulose 7-phosphate isomerase
MSVVCNYCTTAATNFSALADHEPEILTAAAMVVAALRSGGKVMFCGNGGSAADAQHLAAELVGRYRHDRSPLPGLALTTDTSALTAIGNDYGFDLVFARQLGGIARKGDVLVAISTSGRSPNVIEGLRAARDLGVRTIGLTGAGGADMCRDMSRDMGPSMGSLCDVLICVPSTETNHIQEMHIAVGHMICGIVEAELCSDKR